MRRRPLIGATGVLALSLAAGIPAAWATWSVQGSFDATTQAGALRRPGQLSVSPRADGANDPAIVLRWTAADVASGTVDPTGYRIERSPAGRTAWRALDLGASCPHRVCTATDTTTELNRSYRYRVTSRAGTSWQSDPSAVRLAVSARPLTARTGPGTSTLESVAADPASNTREHFDTTGWGRQVAPSRVDEHLLARADGEGVTVATRPAGTDLPAGTCPAPGLRAAVTVPAGPRPAIAPVASARVTYRFTGSPAAPRQLVVLASADGGATWSGHPLPPDSPDSSGSPDSQDSPDSPDSPDSSGSPNWTTVTVAFPGLTWDTSAPRTVNLCVAGAADGGWLDVDLVHLDVQE